VSARAHPRAVGAFVIGAIAIVLGAIVALSAGDWFAPKDRFAVFFPGSVRGLNPGAPVTFRGVKIGEVKDVTAFLTGGKEPLIQIEVVIEFSRKVIETPDGGAQPWGDVRGQEMARRLIEAGIRARMLSQSLLTGQKAIDFDFLPNEEARLAGLSRRYPELPTTATAIEKWGQKGEDFANKLAELPLDQMLDDLHQALRALHALLDSPDLKGALGGARRSMQTLGPTVDEARATFADLRKLSATLEAELKGTASEASEAARQLRSSLERAEQALKRFDDLAAGTDETRLHATEALRELSSTLAALRNLVEYVQTHPEALVLGKPGAEEKKR
jgi:paraquat-inducible protein B